MTTGPQYDPELVDRWLQFQHECGQSECQEKQAIVRMAAAQHAELVSLQERLDTALVVFEKMLKGDRSPTQVRRVLEGGDA